MGSPSSTLPRAEPGFQINPLRALGSEEEKQKCSSYMGTVLPTPKVIISHSESQAFRPVYAANWQPLNVTSRAGAHAALP